MQSKMFKKEPIIKFKITSRKVFAFLIDFTVDEYEHIFIFPMVTADITSIVKAVSLTTDCQPRCLLLLLLGRKNGSNMNFYI